MISRYTRPEMGAVWSEKNKADRWLQVEIAVCEVWAERGVVPPEDMAKIRGASYDLEKWAEYEREMHHDFNAFVRSVADSLGEESRWIRRALLTTLKTPPSAFGFQRLSTSSGDLEALLHAIGNVPASTSTLR
jgi:adenylosuccinate lyase